MKKQIKKSISVWLIVEDGENKGKIALQKRSLDNKSFVFVCQATWAGKVEPNESPKKAVERECKEELGEEFAKNFNFSSLKIFCKNKYKIKNDEWQAISFLGTINENSLKTAKIHGESFPFFLFVGKNNKIFPISHGKDPQNNIVLFDDQYKVWEKILKEKL